MKKIYKSTYREIKKTLGRFLGILVIIAVGCAFFTGLKSVKPDMELAGEKYLTKSNFMDFQILSSIGFNEEDVESVKQAEGIRQVEANYSLDSLGKIENQSKVVKLSSIPQNINTLQLIQGRLPEKSGECVVLANKFDKGIKPGTVITLTSGTDKDLSESIKIYTYEVVGTVTSPLYITNELGTSKIGNGSVQELVFVPSEDFLLPAYSGISLVIDGTDKLMPFSEEYDNYIAPCRTSLEELGENRALTRQNEIKLDVETKLAEKETEYNDNLKKLEDSKAEFNVEMEEAQWYVIDRESNAGYSEYKEGTERIGGLAEILPIMFFMIAALVCLTSMTRMVDEQRTQIGTMKALGYRESKIAFKYIFYAVSASALGSIAGVLVGYRLIPGVIFRSYKALYSLPLNEFPIQFEYAFGSAVMGIAVTALAAYFTCKAALASVPSALMRPLAPKTGKRLLLERVTFLWKRLKFSQKVTLRNIFRYKKRFIMTVFGVGCCCALVISGFGLKDSIKVPAQRQFADIFVYDSYIRYKDAATIDEKQNVLTAVQENSLVKEMGQSHVKSMEINNGDNELKVTLIVPENPEELNKFIHLRQPGSGVDIALTDNNAVMTEKAADLLGVKKGDRITTEKEDGSTAQIEIGLIAENYLMNYVFMSQEYYRAVFEEKADINQILINQLDTSEERQSEFGELFTGMEGVSAVGFLSDMQNNLDKTLNSLDLIVWVILISAGLLAFVVLYTLTTININERMREIATIKVLGFFDREVNSYIFRESYILTFVGILLGMAGGTVLHQYIIDAATVEQLMYYKQIMPLSFLYSAVLTFLFSFIVSTLLKSKIKNINMVEALKSVE